jgi:hypothetical protein
MADINPMLAYLPPDDSFLPQGGADRRRRAVNAMVAAQYDRPTPQDTTVTERAGLLPIGTYANGMTGLAFPGFIADPVAGFYREATNPVSYLNRSEDEKRQTVETGFDVAGAAMVGGLAAPKPNNTVGIFGGRLAKTADLQKLAQAEEMTARGVPGEQIWKETGWFPGIDGKWRFEIDDSKMNIDGPGSVALSNRPDDKWLWGPASRTLDHPNLLSAYPDMGSTIVDARIKPGLNAYGLADQNSITARGPTQGAVNSEALHELQHGIQRREGFASGGMPENGNFDTYNRLAGEVESRAVQARKDLTPEQRATRPPWLDYDVPYDQQIVRFGNDGPQLSAESRPGAAGAALSGAGERTSLMDRTMTRFGKPRDPFANPESGQPFIGSGYHGSPDNQFAAGTVIDRADPSAYMSPYGPWIASNRDVGSTYSRVDPDAPFFSGSNVMPMEARFKNPMVYDAQGRPGAEAHLAPGNVAMDTNDLSGIAKERGHDGLVVKNVRDEMQGGGALSDVYHPLQRGTVYSPLTGDLLYANGGRPGGIAGAAISSPNDPAVNELLRQYGIELPKRQWSNAMLPGDA